MPASSEQFLNPVPKGGKLSAMTRSNPTFAQRLLMAILADERKRAGFNLVEAAELAGLDQATISRYENGKRRPHPNQVKTLMKVYGESEDVATAMADMAEAAATPGWWHKHRKGMPAWLTTFLGLESSASMLRLYESQVVPGIAQTEEYHRALLAASVPRVALEEVEGIIALRQDRQGILNDDATAPELKMIIEQAALERPVGGPKVMADQLMRLADLGGNPRNRVQVMPTKEVHAGISGSFVVFDFPASDYFAHLKLPSVVYSEGYRGALYLEEPEDLLAHEQAFEAMTASAASPEDSLVILHRMAAEMAA